MFFFFRFFKHCKEKQLQFEAATRAKFPSLFEKSNWELKHLGVDYLTNTANNCLLVVCYNVIDKEYRIILERGLELLLTKQEKKYLFKFLLQLLKELETKRQEDLLQKAKEQYINV